LEHTGGYTPEDAMGVGVARTQAELTKAAALGLDVTPLVVLTIGHSTRTIRDFIRLLKAHEVQRVIDVRTIPRSQHNPQFNRDQLSPALHRARIHYRHMPGLGGLRRARRDSTNMGWQNASFRGYADYMQTATFRQNLDRCIALARRERVVLMCAEAVPWRCHRSLIADALLVRGIDAREITSGVRTRPHLLTPWARVNRSQITYPAARSASSAISGAR
jgi:uncharacterized protein (DUF488 family)